VCNPDNNGADCIALNSNKPYCCLRDNGVGNDPIFICTPAIQRCQPGPASSNTCEAASPDPMCDGSEICCKEIPGLGATPFTCVDDPANCPSDECIDEPDVECSFGPMDFCCDGKCFESEPLIPTL